MKQRVILAIVTLAASTLPSALAQCEPGGGAVDPSIPQEVLFRVAPDANPAAAIATILQRYPGATIERSIDVLQTYQLRLPGGVSECAAALDLELSLVRTDPNVPEPGRPLSWAEANYEGQSPQGHTGTIYDSREASFSVAFNSQYAVNLLGLPGAHARSTGRGTVVAVLDTGVDASHPVLAGRTLPGTQNFVLPGTGTGVYANGLDDDGDGVVDELVAHGTYVAGLIALVAPEAQILPIVVLNSDGVSDLFTVAQGMHAAIDAGVDVINLSLSTDYKGDVLEDALNRAFAQGIAVVAAAGNRNRNVEEYPACLDEAIGVSAVSEQGVRGSFSNYNIELDVAAPGVSVRMPGDPDAYDPDHSVVSPIPDTEYAMWEGTSAATPFVAGAVALVYAQETQWPKNPTRVINVLARLVNTGVNIDPVNVPAVRGQLGRRLSASAAVALGPVQPPVGDINRDGGVDLVDLAMLLRDFGGPAKARLDLDLDGTIGLTDLALLLTNFGL